MPKGEYFIGDLHNALDSSDGWSNEEGKHELSDGKTIGYFEFEGCQTERDREERDNIDFREYIEGDEIGITLLVNVHDHWEDLGISVVFEEEFECTKDTLSHYKHDDHMTSICFGGGASWDTIHGSYETDDESDEDSNVEEDVSISDT